MSHQPATKYSVAVALVVLGLTLGSSQGRKTEWEADPGPVEAGAVAFPEPVQPVYFGVSRSGLDETAREILRKNAEWLRQQPPLLIQVAGYADNRGSARRNRTLAERRAANVRDYYVSLGISGDRIEVVGLEEEPACAAVTEECLAASRRAETRLDPRPFAARP